MSPGEKSEERCELGRALLSFLGFGSERVERGTNLIDENHSKGGRVRVDRVPLDHLSDDHPR